MTESRVTKSQLDIDSICKWHHDTQHCDTQNNDIQDIDTQHNNFQFGILSLEIQSPCEHYGLNMHIVNTVLLGCDGSRPR